MDGDGGDHEQEVKHCQGHQQAVKWIFPQLQYGIVLLLKKFQYGLSSNLWRNEHNNGQSIAEKTNYSDQRKKNSLHQPKTAQIHESSQKSDYQYQ